MTRPGYSARDRAGHKYYKVYLIQTCQLVQTLYESYEGFTWPYRHRRSTWWLGFRLLATRTPTSFSSWIDCRQWHGSRHPLTFWCTVWWQWQMCITLHFFWLKRRSNLFHQSKVVQRLSCWSWILSSTPDIVLQILVSSANISLMSVIQSEISFTKIKNNNGPRVDLCGTPFSTLVQLGCQTRTLTRIYRLHSKSNSTAGAV